MRLRFDRRRTLRVIVDGPDMCGKTTLATSLTAALSDHGISVRHAQGYWRRNPAYALVRVAAAISGSRRRNPAYGPLCAIASILDRYVPSPIRKNLEVLVVESYIDRAIAYGRTVDRALWSRAAARYAGVLFPRFDLAIVVYADLATRQERLRARTDWSLADHLTSADEEVHAAFQAEVVRLAGRYPRRLALDTTRFGPADTLGASLTAVLEELGRVRA